MKAWTLALAATSVAVTGMAAPAMAGATVKNVEAVSFEGLDLNTVEGQKLLDQRVEAAVRRVCNYSRGLNDPRNRHDAHECLAQARASASAQVAAVIEDQRRGG